MGKRKRQSGTDGAEVPEPKKQATEKDSAVGAAERRQQRSERKSKKLQQSKDAHATQRPSRKQKQPELVTAAATMDTDTLAGGDDFVPLLDSDPSPPVPKSTSKLSKHKSTSSPAAGSQHHKGRETKKQKTAVNDQSTPALSDTAKDTSKKPSKDTARFICFVGNLPFTCTTDQIRQHFRKLDPTSIRHSTDKATGKSKGFAFLEFDDFSKMKTCLKVYHHSMFDPERTSKLPDDAFDANGLEITLPGQEQARHKGKGRKINVELTAGGGGAGAERKEKIRTKNTKLWEERERRKTAEAKSEKTRLKKKEHGHSLEKSEANATEIGSEAVHPSRLQRVPGK